MLCFPWNFRAALGEHERDSRMPCASTMCSIDRPRRGAAAWSPAVRTSFLIPSTIALVACSSGGRASRPGPLPITTPSALLTEPEITREGARTVYETIERLRPRYLSRTRTRGASCERVAYLDGMRLGGLDELRGVSAVSVQHIRSLSGPDATTLFGRGHCAGAIVVVTRGGR